jgi:aminoglycoside phosphotransferase (APT) family kinase protein
MLKEQLRDNLQTFIHDRIGAEYELAGLHESDGHAGLTFLFETRRKGEHDVAGRYVLKIPPAGVARRGNTDVYRQAPLLRALHAAGLPVPDVPYADENEHWFGVPFIVMERLPGRVFFVWDPHASFTRDKEGTESLWRQCVEALPRIHRFDWRTHLKDWQAPEPLEEQVRRWRKIYLHSPEPRWIEQAEEVEQLLLKTLPEADPIGVFHGDYQPGNVLYDQARLTGIIDWELAGIGAQLLDIGWLMMAADRHNWVDEWCSIHPPAPAELRAIYEAGMGRSYADIPWYQAFAGFRLGSIGCLNVKLHRKGQRHDPIWEMMALTLSNMFERARQLLLDPKA